eukprot:TRINITY_DN595_c6_g3_i1.p1 TRINITY_DN595_c6_g3~~TRINITY_DN595_c6_g3_i1.p1  ORF type:complete len:278 (+),score=37.73 TRINITY_DN595_c6_g3_i1:89-922(+)
MGLCYSLFRRKDRQSERVTNQIHTYSPVPSSPVSITAQPREPVAEPNKKTPPPPTTTNKRIASTTEITMDSKLTILSGTYDIDTGIMEVVVEVDSPQKDSVLVSSCCCSAQVTPTEVLFSPQPGISNETFKQGPSGSESGIHITACIGQQFTISVTIPPENVISNESMGYYPLVVALVTGDQSRYCFVNYFKNNRRQFTTKDVMVRDGVAYMLKKVFTTSNTNECTICMSVPATIVLLPCRHKCVCPECIDEILSSDKCPLCRSKVAKCLTAVESES